MAHPGNIDLTRMSTLSEEKLKKLTGKNLSSYQKSLRGWSMRGMTLSRNLRFKNFRHALDFVNEVGEIAEREGHHPDILIFSWNRVKLVFYTHYLKGLTANDFIVAAKVNKLIDNKYALAKK